MAGKKRASPGADVEKNPLQSVELSDADAQKLQEVTKDLARVEYILERDSIKALSKVFERRRAVLKSIPRFWPVALINHSTFAFHAQHIKDQTALSYLEDVWITRDPNENRCFTIEFFFKENPFFSDSVLKKEFKYVLPPAASDEKPDEDGITPSQLDFAWERDVQPTAMKINWKDPENALTKLHPRIAEIDDDDDVPAESGSFFNFFEIESDPFDLGTMIVTEIFPEAVDYFLGNHAGDDLDSEDEDEEDDEDDAEEIDLTKPNAKRQKKN